MIQITSNNSFSQWVGTTSKLIDVGNYITEGGFRTRLDSLILHTESAYDNANSNQLFLDAFYDYVNTVSDILVPTYDNVNAFVRSTFVDANTYLTYEIGQTYQYSNINFDIANTKVDSLESNVIISFDYSNVVYDEANLSYDYANAVYDYANAVYDYANTANTYVYATPSSDYIQNITDTSNNSLSYNESLLPLQIDSIDLSVLNEYFTPVQLVTGTARVENNGTLSLSEITDLQPGDVVFVATVRDASTVTTPTGFTNIVKGVTGGTVYYGLAYKIMSDPVDTSITGLGTNGDSAHLAWAVRNYDASLLSSSLSGYTTAENTTGMPNPPLMSDVSWGEMVIGVGFLDDDQVTATAAAGSTLIDFYNFTYASIYNGTVMAAYVVQNTSYPTNISVDIGTFVGSGSDAWFAVTIKIPYPLNINPSIFPHLAANTKLDSANALSIPFSTQSSDQYTQTLDTYDKSNNAYDLANTTNTYYTNFDFDGKDSYINSTLDTLDENLDKINNTSQFIDIVFDQANTDITYVNSEIIYPNSENNALFSLNVDSNGRISTISSPGFYYAPFYFTEISSDYPNQNITFSDIVSSGESNLQTDFAAPLLYIPSSNVAELENIELTGSKRSNLITIDTVDFSLNAYSNGITQYLVLNQDLTVTDELESGQSIELIINKPSDNIITWPTTTWIGGTPTFYTGNNFVDFVKIDSTLYGKHIVNENLYFGESIYTTPGTYSWTAPEDVYSVCVVCVGAGGGARTSSSYGGGGGGGLGWKNDISVVPGDSYTVVVGEGIPSANGGDSYFIDTTTVAGFGGLYGRLSGQGGSGGTYVGDGGGNGGTGDYYNADGGGGGGAGGYLGSGGNATDWESSRAGVVTLVKSSYGGGSGGLSMLIGGTGGGGTGLYGIGDNGDPITYNSYNDSTSDNGGKGGSRGADGGERVANNWSSGSSTRGGFPGGGAGHFDESVAGANGAVRIIWGEGRSFPENAYHPSEIPLYKISYFPDASTSNTTTDSTVSITQSEYISEGDLLILLATTEGGTSGLSSAVYLSSSTPPGWTYINGSFLDTTNSSSILMAYKIADGTEGGTTLNLNVISDGYTVPDGSAATTKTAILSVFRPNGDGRISNIISTATGAQSTTGPASSQTITATNSTSPVTISLFGSLDGSPYGTILLTPIYYHDIFTTSTTNPTRLGFRIYNTTNTQDWPVAISDGGDYNNLITAYLSLS